MMAGNNCVGVLLIYLGNKPLQQDHSALIDVYLPRKILPIIAMNLGWGSKKILEAPHH
jgi:hypothetical protein